MGFMTPPVQDNQYFGYHLLSQNYKKTSLVRWHLRITQNMQAHKSLIPLLFTCQLQPEIKLKKNKPRHTKQEIDLTRQSPIYKKGSVGGC